MLKGDSIMRKFTAILGCIATLVIAVVGFSMYSDHSGVITWFGIELSQTGFLFLILAFVVIDFFNVRSAFGEQKKIEQAQEEAQARAAERTKNTEPLGTPCAVEITRKSSMLGAAMGVDVYLNGESQGVLKNGQTVYMQTSVAENELSIHYRADGTRKSVEFTATPGGRVCYELKYTGAVLTRV